MEDISGFLEIGLLPSPKPLSYTWEGVETSGYLDVPYFGNVAIGLNLRVHLILNTVFINNSMLI